MTLNDAADYMGLVGLFLIIAGTGWGVAMAGRRAHVHSLSRGGRAWWDHRASGLVGLLLLIGHPIPLIVNGTFTFPEYLHAYGRGIYPETSLGILSFYVLVVVVVSAIAQRHLPRWAWRWLHWLSYVMIGLGLAHGMYEASFGFGPEADAIYFMCALTAAIMSVRVWHLLGQRRPPHAVATQRAAAVRLGPEGTGPLTASPEGRLGAG